MSWPVNLYVYDLSNGIAKQLSKQLTGRQIDGIWHTSVVVFGAEFFYGQGINMTPPGQSHHGKPLQILHMGDTSIDEDTFNDYIQEMKEHYTADKYHLLDFNCNSFTNDVIGFLTGQSIPSSITDLPTDFLSTPFGAALRPTIDAMYRRSYPIVTPGPVASSSIGPQLTTPSAVTDQVSGNHAPGRGSATGSLTGPVHVITNPTSFHTFLHTHKTAVAFFTSSTCGPCRMIEPLFLELAEAKGQKSGSSAPKGVAFAKIDIGVGLGHILASDWRVKATPTFMFFLDGSKIHEVRGPDAAELKTQIDLLLFQAYPPHPHMKLSLPLIQKISLTPILFTHVPPANALTTKLSSFIDSARWPASPSHSKEEVKIIIHDRIAPYLEARQTVGKQSEQAFPVPPTTLITSWSQASVILINSISVENLFPVVDLWRLLVLESIAGAWPTSQQDFSTHPLSMLLAVAHNQKTTCPRNYLLTFLRLLSNTFANPAIAQRLVIGVEKKKLTEVAVQTLLHDDVMVRNASASLIFNLAGIVQKKRIQDMSGTDKENKELIETDDDEDWEVEIISVIIEGLRREKGNEEYVHRLTAALAFIVRLSPFWETHETLLQVLQCREVLEGQAGEGSSGEWRNSEIKKLVEEVVVLCHPPA